MALPEIKRSMGSFLLVIILLAILIIFPAECSGGIMKGLKNSAEIIVPSLFPFMILSSFIVRTKALKPVESIFSVFTEKIFFLPKECTSALILSFIGGFPIGAKCVSVLYEQGVIKSDQAQRMMNFCVCSGPSFMITGIGTIILHNTQAGVMLYLSQIISGVLIGIISGIYSRIRDKEKTDNIKKENSHSQGLLEAFISSAEDGANSIISMTALICFFSMLICVYQNSFDISRFINIRELRTFIPILTEVTSGTVAVRETGLPLWWYSVAVGFGGMCVHFQILLMLKGIPFSFGKYLIFRVINCIISGFAAKILCSFFVPVGEVFRVFGNTDAQVSSVGIVGSTALVVMCAVFLLSLRKRELCRNIIGKSA